MPRFPAFFWSFNVTPLPNTAMRLAKYDCAFFMAEISLSLYYCMTAILKIEMSVWKERVFVFPCSISASNVCSTLPESTRCPYRRSIKSPRCALIWAQPVNQSFFLMAFKSIIVPAFLPGTKWHIHKLAGTSDIKIEWRGQRICHSPGWMRFRLAGGLPVDCGLIARACLEHNNPFPYVCKITLSLASAQCELIWCMHEPRTILNNFVFKECLYTLLDVNLNNMS